MLSNESGFFLRIPDESDERVLHPATVVEVQDKIYTAQLEEPDLPLSAGQNVLLYYEIDRKFMQQAARIDAVMQVEPEAIIGLETIGEPMSAEERQWYRVSTILTDLSAKIDSEELCRIQDVSTVGFAVLARDRHFVGSAVTATVQHEGKRYSGSATVQSVREIGDGWCRYGLACAGDKQGGAELSKCLHTITMAIQRQQLRRRARGS